MGLRGEIFSTRVQLENRTYFFNVKENRLGDIYLNIVESKNKEEGGGFERQSVVLFAEDLAEFLSGFDEALKVMDKADREKRRESRFSSGDRTRSFQGARPSRSGFSSEDGGFSSHSSHKKRVVVQKTRDSDHSGEKRGGDSGKKRRKMKPVSKKRGD
jgi:hypothetical protein